jgi:hypothetical protein
MSKGLSFNLIFSLVYVRPSIPRTSSPLSHVDVSLKPHYCKADGNWLDSSINQVYISDVLYSKIESTREGREKGQKCQAEVVRPSDKRGNRKD